MKLNLVENGIFPIENQTQVDSTGYGVSGTFQGEGKLIGTACLFIRTSGCNLRCSWVGVNGEGSPCDTPYSSHSPEKNKLDIEEIIDIVIMNTTKQKIKHIVISGGEPTIQKKPLAELLYRLKVLGYHTTIETNATIYTDEIAQGTDLVSMSPKLSSSTPWIKNLKNTGIEFNLKWAEKHELTRINIEAMQSYIDFCRENNKDFQLKFVVTDDKDIVEIEEILEQLKDVNPDDVCLMPEGVDVSSLNSRTKWASEEALKRGWRFTPRLHILMFGKNRYV